MLNIVLVTLRYPYGKSQTFMNGSLCSAASVLVAAGHKVEVIDLNLDDEDQLQDKFAATDFIGVSLVGAPFIPSSLEFIDRMKRLVPKTPILLGGQVIERLSEREFAAIYGERAVQVKNKTDLAKALGCSPSDLPEWSEAPMLPVWQTMGDKRLRQYLSTEFTLVISQGCVFQCVFCAARKAMKEQHVHISIFESDMHYLAAKAFEFGISELSCYTSSLDFFQNPFTVKQHLEILAKITRDTGIRFKVRCLSCVSSFLRAERAVPGLETILRNAGLYCIGFGVDGTEEIWKVQKKTHNAEDDVPMCLATCHKMGIRTEILIVMGYQEDNLATLSKLFLNTLRYVFTWPKGVDIRPYLNKEVVPGNEGWNRGNGRIAKLLANPSLFYNLDFAACASRLTHPRVGHRHMVNVFYLAIIAVFKLIGRCPNNPLFPQGGKGLGPTLAKLANRLMPFDR
ncbi:MAG: hypothetical protein A2751_01865 [Candidatus Doudnabacteria bacterium RIFCSPHIGHO2_01_FULL_46_14]|uniref:Radical SAM core domain-containing protein n=1 Tax=Candidatus Doudnabacteria bacterium RIFCSPHIGHO2_01_FULL_46_14 TaxID=1817824 RepID=A0A1F5NJ99_9BACT|nr:MAG: hypothetical protein A2751_01865 [Candidatus Doudnabacteria bacterium RIFCSPHIGHO2_01_FULL_46_14]